MARASKPGQRKYRLSAAADREADEAERDAARQELSDYRMAASVEARHADELQAERDALREERDKLQAAMDEAGKRLDNRTLHRLVCNADHSKEIGGPACICVPRSAWEWRSEALRERVRALEEAGRMAVQKLSRHEYLADVASALLDLRAALDSGEKA